MFNHHLTNQEALKALDDTVYGHTEAKKALIRAVNRQRLYYHQVHNLGNKEGGGINLQNVLLVGPSGTGKTFLVEQLAKICEFNLVKLDATQIVPSGSTGKLNVSKIVETVVDSCKYYVNKSFGYFTSTQIMHQTIVFVDEIDKLTVPSDSSGNWSKNVQANLLQLVENKAELDGVVFVFAGAFVHLYDELKTEAKAKAKKAIGFASGTEEKKEEEEDAGGQFSMPLEDLVVKSGMLPELAGRIGSIAALEDLTQEHYEEIINKFLLPAAQKELKQFNIDGFELSSGQIEKIAKRALGSSQGVRSARREISKLTADLEFNYPEPIALVDYLSEFEGEDGDEEENR